MVVLIVIVATRSVEVHVPATCIGAVFSSLAHHGGCIVSDEVVPGSDSASSSSSASSGHLCRHAIVAHMPAAMSFGLTGDLQGATSGQAFPQCRFLQWAVVPGDPYTANSVLSLPVDSAAAAVTALAADRAAFAGA